MRKNKITFISPHLDDAIFSGGGAIINHLRKGDDVSVVTIFSGIPGINNFSDFFSSIAYRGWVNDRIKENTDILNSIKVKSINLNFLDAIFRKDDLGKFLCLSWSDIFLDDEYKFKEECVLCNLIREKMLKFTKNKNEILYFPLSLGNHLDHVLVNKIGKELNTTYEEQKIYYYEDLPYANYSIDIDKLYKMYAIEKIEEIDINYKISLVSGYKKSLEVGDNFSVVASHIKNHAAGIGESGKYFERFWRYRNT